MTRPNTTATTRAGSTCFFGWFGESVGWGVGAKDGVVGGVSVLEVMIVVGAVAWFWGLTLIVVGTVDVTVVESCWTVVTVPDAVVILAVPVSETVTVVVTVDGITPSSVVERGVAALDASVSFPATAVLGVGTSFARLVALGRDGGARSLSTFKTLGVGT